MSTDFVLASVFGFIVIVSAFVVGAWVPVLRNGAETKLKVVAVGMLVATIGVVLLATNRVLAATAGDKLIPALLIIAGITILIGKTVWFYGAQMGRPRWAFYTCLALCALWQVFCLWRFA